MKPKLRIAILLLIVTLTSAPGQTVGPIANPANGHYYYLLGQSAWVTAEQDAVSLGGHLASITNAAENQWILDTFSQYGGQSRNLWIGLNDRAAEGDFQWSSGETVSYTNWDPGQPDNGGGSFEEDGTFMWPSTSPSAGKWGDAADSFSGWAYGVVEVVPPVVQIQGGVAVSWTSRSNLHYQVQYSSILSSNSWTNLGSTVTAAGTNSTVFDPFGNNSKRFYRVIPVP